MSYYIIEISDKKAAYRIADPAIRGKKVFFNPFTGIIEIKHSINATKLTTYQLKQNTFNPKNVLWILHKLGFTLKYDENTNYVELRLPNNTTQCRLLVSVFEHLYDKDPMFLRFDSLFYEGDSSLLSCTYTCSINRLGAPFIIDIPNVVDNLVLPDIED